jgi:flagellar basal-body rod protein FlgB
MNLEGLGLFHLMGGKMGWLSARQTVLSQNVANADTPGFVAKDLKPFTFKTALQTAGSLAVARTDSQHLTGLKSNSLAGTVDSERFETRPDGNAVSLEDQLGKVADTGTEYQMVVNLYRKQIGLIKTAIGRGGNS